MAVGHLPTTRAVGGTRSRRRLRLALTNEFQLLINNVSVSVPRGARRVLAFLAISGRPVPRSRVAGHLWIDVPEWRALGNIRTALWRLHRLPLRVISSLDDRLALAPEVEVDLVQLNRLADQLAEQPDSATLAQVPRLVEAADLLPGWGDDWLIIERERFRERRLHALERASEQLLETGHHAAAALAALAAVETEPFRDSAQRTLVRVHLSEGNRAAALQAFHAYQNLMAAELGVEPSDSMRELVSGVNVDAGSHNGRVTGV